MAIVGQGYMGQTHARAWTQLGCGDQIRYVVSRSRRNRALAAPNARFVSNFGLVLADPAVDVVSVCTPTALHPEFAIRALNAGKHVLLEKPIALTLGDASRVLAAAVQSDALLMVAHVVRFFAGYVRARVMAQSGELGELHSVRAERTMATPTWSSSISDVTQSGGVLVDFAIHDFDQANLFLGVPESVDTVRLRTSAIVSTIRYRDGGVAEILTDAARPAGMPLSSALDIRGPHGSLSYRFTANVPSGAGHGEPAAAASLLTIKTNVTDEVVTAPQNDAYLAEIRYFLRCIEAGSEPVLCPPEASVTALAVSLAARESLRTGRRSRVQNA